MVLKDLFYLKRFSSSNCAAPMNANGELKVLRKHARSFIYAITLNETGCIGLFFLTENIYEICLRKGLIWGN